MKQLFSFILLLACGSLWGQDGLHTRNVNLPCLDKNFNIMVHLTVDSTTRQPFFTNTMVDDLLQKTSKFFEPICLSMSACEVNIIENYTFHNLVDQRRLRELEVLFAKPRRINLFIVGTIPEATCGVSSYYGVKQDGGTSIYIEMDSRECIGSLEGQLAHHIGHFMGLADTYHGNGLEVVDDLNCAMRGDSICDTRTDPFGLRAGEGSYVSDDILPEEIGLSSFVNDCEFIHEFRDPNGEWYQPMVGNAMAAYQCECGLTNGQFLKMVENYSRSNHKPY